MNRRGQIIDKIITFIAIVLYMALSAAMGVILVTLALAA